MADERKPCEVCGKPATHLAADHKENAPAKWEEDGAPHYFCADHARPQRLTFINGRCWEGREEIKR